MRASNYLIAGFLSGALVGAMILIGPDRISNVYCGVTDCPVTATLDDICAMATIAEKRAPSQRAVYLAQAFAASWPTKEGRRIAERVGTAAPGEKFDVLLDALENDRVTNWSCPAITRLIGAPVATSMRRIVVDGRPVVELAGGIVRSDDIDASKMAIDPLYEVLRQRDTSEALSLGVHPALPFQTIAQIVYSAGLAGYQKVDLRLLNLNVEPVRIDLAPYGTCNDCLVEIAGVRRRPSEDNTPIMAVIGRRSTEPRRHEPMLAEDALRLTVALSDHGEAWIAGRGGVLPPRVGPADGATVPAGAHGPSYDELKLRIAQVEASLPKETGVVVTADLGTRASQFHRMIASIQSADAVGLETIMLAVSMAVLDNQGLVDDEFAGATGVTLSTHAQLSAPVRVVAPRSTPALTSTQRRPRATSKRRKARRAKARSATATKRGSLSDLFKPHLGAVRDCYEQGLRLNRQLEGKVMLHLDILADGSTANVTAEDTTLGSADVTHCIERSATTWRLAAPDSAPLSVAYPIVLKPRTL